jgi:hypothetical protein
MFLLSTRIMFIGALVRVTSALNHGNIFAGRKLRVPVAPPATSNPFEEFFSNLKSFPIPTAVPSTIAGNEFDIEISVARSLLVKAAETKSEDGDSVLQALLSLEKLMRAKAKVNPEVALNTLKNLDGAWRLVFTTGTVDTQKKLKGRINYFPLKAVQCFDCASMTITNSIMIGDISIIKFFGPFDFNQISRKVEFDFTAIALFGIKFTIPAAKAASIGAATGLGSENNSDLISKGKRSFFNWISADEEIATARGGGGGLALWRRDIEMQEANAADSASFKDEN